MSKAKFVNPFRGLRPFDAAERHLFFGRSGEIEALEEKLEAHHFLGVIGTSGSGKSSLVRAGLVPELLDMGDWRVALMRPGDAPIENLATALNSCKAENSDKISFWRDGEEAPSGGRYTVSTLRQGALGLIDTVREFRIEEKILIVIDQFEEIFRFEEQRSEQHRADARDFIQLVIEASRQRELPIYICITMRSDFLGQCPLFRGLPAALNDSQYLVPRLTRAGIRQAIKEPILWAGADITPRLVTQLLNEVVSSQDQLPLLQNALMRTFANFLSDPSTPDLLDIQHFSGMQEALSDHLDLIYETLTSAQQEVAAHLFKSLTMVGTSGSAVRRPCTVREVLEISNATEADIFHTVDVFRAEGNSFLMPPYDESISLDTVLDVTHESLIRVWPRIRQWTREESESAEIYLELVGDAEAHRDGRKGLLGQPELGLLRKWKAEAEPDQGWANRYNPSLDLALSYLTKSHKIHWVKRMVSILLPILLLAAYASFEVSKAKSKAEFEILTAIGEAKDARLKLERYKLEQILRSEKMTIALVKEFGGVLQGTTQEEFHEYMRFLSPFADGALEPGETFFDFLDTIMLARTIEGELSGGDKLRLSELYWTMDQRIKRYRANVDAYDVLDISHYFDKTIKSIEALYPRTPIASLPGSMVVFGRDTVITAKQKEILVFNADITGLQTDSDTELKLSATYSEEHNPHSNRGTRNDAVADLATSTDAARLVSASRRGRIIVWDFAGSQPEPVKEYDFSLEEQSVRSKSGEPDAERDEGSTISSVEIAVRTPSGAEDVSPGYWILAANNKGSVVVWNDEGEAVAILEDELSAEEIASVAVSDDGARVVTASRDTYARVYELGSNPMGIIGPSLKFQHKQRVFDAEVTSTVPGQQDLGLVVTASRDKQFVKVWEDEANVMATLVPSVGQLYMDDIEFSPGETYLATAGRDNLINIWKTSELERVNEDVPDTYHRLFRGSSDKAGANRIRFDPDFSNNHRIAVTTKKGITYLWNVNEVNSFDRGILEQQPIDLPLDVKLELGSIDTSGLEKRQASTEELIKIAKSLISNKRNRGGKNDVYLANFDRKIKSILLVLHDRLTGADNWGDRWDIYQYFSNAKHTLKDSELSDLFAESDFELVRYRDLINTLPVEHRGAAYQLLAQSDGDDRSQARIAVSLQIAGKTKWHRDGAKKYLVSVQAQRVHANEVTNRLVDETKPVERVSEKLTQADLESLGAVTKEDWLIDDSTDNLVKAARYFSKWARNRLFGAYYSVDYLDILGQLSDKNISDHTASYCSFAREAQGSRDKLGGEAQIESMQKSSACLIWDELRRSGLAGAQLDASMQLVLQSVSEPTQNPSSVLAAIQSAGIAIRESARAASYRVSGNATSVIHENTALLWSVSARHLVDNAVTRSALDTVLSQVRPTPKALFNTEDDIKAVSFTHDGKFVLVGGVDRKLHQFVLDGTARDHLEGHTSAIYKILPLSNEEIATSATDNKMIYWDVTPESRISLKQTIRLEPRDGRPIGPPMITGSRENGFLISGNPLDLISPDGLLNRRLKYRFGVMVTGGNIIAALSNKIVLLSSTDDTPLVSESLGGGSILSLNAAENYIASGTTAGITRIWDLELNLVLDLPKLEGQVKIVTFRKGGKSFFVGTYRSGMVYEYDLAGNQLLAFRADSESVYDIAIHPDDPDLILTGGIDHDAKLWSLAEIRAFKTDFFARQNDELSLDDLVKQGVLVSDHLAGSVVRHASSPGKAAQYLTDRHKKYSGDDVFSQSIRTDVEKTSRLLIEKFPDDQELSEELGGIIKKPE